MINYIAVGTEVMMDEFGSCLIRFTSEETYHTIVKYTVIVIDLENNLYEITELI